MIAAAIAFTVILPLLAACFQAALWFAARDAALSAARQGAETAAAQGGTLGGGLAAACQYARTAAAGILRGPACTGTTGNTVTITVTGAAPVHRAAVPRPGHRAGPGTGRTLHHPDSAMNPPIARQATPPSSWPRSPWS